MTTIPTKARQHTVYKLADGTRVPGVTTVLGLLAKPQLVKWANNLGLQGIDSNKYVDELAQIGTLAHYLIICDLTGETPNVREYSQEQQDRAAQSMLSWSAWRRTRAIEPLLTETPLVSETHRYGGTLDIYALVDGVATIIDIKTAKAIYSEHMTQVVAYQHLLFSSLAQGKSRPERCCIIRVGREPGEGFEERDVTQEAERWEMFKHLLDIYNLQKVLK